ncbi:LppU/SCO3897 family protein [Yinghuangia sp. YIM S10712]|uniref:LppU/SCO3897 family protein n=1 Tax=Yinghuangia sp. YIM S10712 TaxID=3436930 RepID=UPI003F530ED6
MSNPFGPPGPQGPGDQNPYGQQPPYGGPPQQPYGGQPPYPGPPPGQPGWGAQPPTGQPPYPGQMGYMQPRRRKKWPWIVGGIVGLFVVLVIIGYFVGKDDASNAEVGDCLTSDEKSKIIDCDKPGAVFRVVGKFDDTSSTSRCETDDMLSKGSVVTFYWKDGDKAVICATITKNTTVNDLRHLDGDAKNTTPEYLEQVRDELAARGIEGVK